MSKRYTSRVSPISEHRYVNTGVSCFSEVGVPFTLIGVWNEIAPDEREYADRLIKEQYIRQTERRKSNKLLISLSDMKTNAENEKKQKDALNAKQKAAEQKHMNDAANRPAGVQT